MNHDLLISKVFYTTRIRKTIISKFEANLDKYSNIVYYLKNRYTSFFTFRETIFRIYNTLKSANDGESIFLGNNKNLYRTMIENVTFVDNIPTTIYDKSAQKYKNDTAWDVSAAQDKS